MFANVRLILLSVGLCVSLSSAFLQPQHTLQPEPRRWSFDFTNGADDWQGGFADYPLDQDAFYELEWGWRPLPKPFDGHAVYISGNNHSDDLFMFLKYRLADLAPAAHYAFTFRLRFATNAPSNCAGVGGAPGEDVVVKVGASQVEPTAYVDHLGFHRMNIDIGNHSYGGANARVIGNLANGNPDCADPSYRLKEVDNQLAPLVAQTDQAGTAWLLVGTDSGFEATSSIYYDWIEVQAIELGHHVALPLVTR